MEFRETLLAAQRNQQQKSSGNLYYKARFDPPKKEQKAKDKLSANIQKFLAKKDEEEKQKKIEVQKKRDDLQAMRDPKALRKIQKTLKVIKSANKSVLADAIDRENTAVTREGPEQPDQDDYGYESQEAAALYEKMMQKYSKIPDVPKFPTSNNTVKKDINGTRERVKHALRHEDDPVPHKRRRRTDNGERESSPPTKYEPERKKEESKSDKPKIRKLAPPPMDFNQLLKLAEQKKTEPIEAAQKKVVAETEPERPMTKKQRREYEEEMARRQRRQERLDAEKNGGRRAQKDDKVSEKEKKTVPSGFGRIPKLSDKANNHRNNSPRPSDRDKTDDGDRNNKMQQEKEKYSLDKEKAAREKLRLDKERLDKLKAERERIERDIEKLNKDRERLDKVKSKLENTRSDKTNRSVDKPVDKSKLSNKESVKQDIKKSIDLKSQNTYRIDKNSNERKFSTPSKSSDGKYMNGHSTQGKPVPKSREQMMQRNGVKDKVLLARQKAMNGEDSSPRAGDRKLADGKGVARRPDDRKVPLSSDKAGPSKTKVSNSFDFDKHVNSLGKNGMNRNGVRKPDGTRQFPPGDVKRKQLEDMRKKQKRRAVASDSEYDSELDDFIDDADEDLDYSTHIKEIFGYDKSKYRYMDDDDDPEMESSFARQQREEYISKKIGIMEDLEDMRMEAMEKKKSKKGRRISDDDDD